MLFASGWSDANSTVFEVNQLTVDTFEFLGLDATDTNVYAAGTGTGETQKLSSWVEIPQVLRATPNGGTIKYGTIDPVGTRQATKQPIGFDAVGIDLEIGYDPTNATIKAMQAITRVFSKVAFKLVIPGGGRVYGYGNLSCAEFPTSGSKDSPYIVAAGIGFDGRAICYGT